MSTYLLYNNKLRCRMTWCKLHKHVNCQLQKRWFIFWMNEGHLLSLKEGFWGENWGKVINPMVLHYEMGGTCEAWVTGTLNVERRVRQMFKDYIKECQLDKRNQRSLLLLNFR